MSRLGFRSKSEPRPIRIDEVPAELAQELDESAEDLRCGRTEDIGEFLKQSQAKIDAAMARDRAETRRRR